MRKVAASSIVIALAFAACGGDDSDGGGEADSPAEESSNAADDTAADDTAADDSGEEPSDDATTDPAGEEPTEAAGDDGGDGVDLTGVCPDPLVLQTDWFPSPEHGYAYRLIGDAGELDVASGVYSGPLLDTGIDLEIRAGGPYLGYQPTTTTMFVDPGIHLGYVNTDETVSGHASDVPTVAVVAPLEINPQILMWNPEQFDFSSFEEIGASGATVVYFEGGVYIDYMVAKGILDADQVDGSYDGAPARFVAADGGIVQQGFATSEPYFYENELAEWMKPVDYLLVHDSGYEVYSQPLVVRADALDELRPCLAEVVPIVQQAVVDHWTDPDATNQLILDIVDELDSSWVLYPGQMDYSVETALELGVVSNGPDATVGNFDDDRMADVVTLLKDILDGIPADLEPAAVYTNEFIDPTIGFDQ